MAYTSASIVGQQDTLHPFALVLFAFDLGLVLVFGAVALARCGAVALVLRRRGTRERLERRVGGLDFE
jgi:hypothetical protein